MPNQCIVPACITGGSIIVGFVFLGVLTAPPNHKLVAVQHNPYWVTGNKVEEAGRLPYDRAVWRVVIDGK